jgi:hypothetical protein
MALRPAPGPSGPTIPGDFHLLFEQAEPRAPQEAKNTVVLLIAGRPGSTITRLVKQAGERGFQLHVVGVSMGQADRPTLDELARQVGGPPPIFIQSSREYATAYATLLEDFGAACASDDQATQKLRKAISDCCRDKESLCCELRTKEIEVIKIREELLRSLKIVDQCDGNIKQIEKLVRELLSIVKIVKKGDMPPSNDPNVTEILDIIKVTLRKHAEQQIKRIEKMEAAIKVELSATNKQISSIQSVLTEIHKETTVIRQEVIEIHKVIENPHPVKVDVDVVAIADRVVSQARGWLNLFFTLLVILLALVLCCLLISRRVNVSVHRMSPRVEESAVFRPERPSCNDSC